MSDLSLEEMRRGLAAEIAAVDRWSELALLSVPLHEGADDIRRRSEAWSLVDGRQRDLRAILFATLVKYVAAEPRPGYIVLLPPEPADFESANRLVAEEKEKLATEQLAR